ncbi:MAG: hypothetical protein JO256_08495 [Alphaproteobacteria bacterium]|nr:hypothetical protein [Alphaproteobacteria bacterium]
MGFRTQWTLAAFAVAASASLSLAAWAQGEAVLKAGVARLLKDTGVYHVSKTGKTPNFVSDPSWPQPLPHSWRLGQVGGLYVDSHDHIWVYNRPRTMTDQEAGLEDAAPGMRDEAGVPVNGIGFPRPNGPTSDCCRAAPSVLEFDTAGKLLQAWGGPSDPGWLAAHCREADGCIWPNSEHGIYVDYQDNVWISGNGGGGAAPPAPGAAPPAAARGGRAGRGAAGPAPWQTHGPGSDGFVLKFDMKGNFKMRIGGLPTAPTTNDKDSGLNGTPVLNRATDMVVDPKTHRLYVSDGYTNRHVLIVNADTGKYIGSIGAYGNNPVDDAAAAAAGPYINDFNKGNHKPAFFRNPVHCVKIANDGKLYVCDRGNNRIQVFNALDPNLGQTCSNPNGEAGKCGFLAEQFISEHTNTSIPGTAVSINFSTDKAQSCLYVGDNSNMTIYILNRSNLQELGRFGRSGTQVGQFHWLHQVSVDSKGNIYTAEVDTAKRVQKFARFGPLGCSGTGYTTVGGPVE